MADSKKVAEILVQTEQYQKEVLAPLPREELVAKFGEMLGVVPKHPVHVECALEGCRKTFVKKGTRRYCSQGCSQKAQQKQLRELSERRKKCPHCGMDISSLSGKRRKRK